MKSILALILSITLMAFTADAFAGERGYFAKDKEELYGTWINMEYGDRPAQKVVYNPDGTGGGASSINIEPYWKFRYLITGKWTDPEGNIMYKEHWVGDWREEAYSLIKISNSGKTLEMVSDPDKYPSEIDPKNNLYRKYTRK